MIVPYLLMMDKWYDLCGSILGFGMHVADDQRSCDAPRFEPIHLIFQTQDSGKVHGNGSVEGGGPTYNDPFVIADEAYTQSSVTPKISEIGLSL